MDERGAEPSRPPCAQRYGFLLEKGQGEREIFKREREGGWWGHRAHKGCSLFPYKLRTHSLSRHAKSGTAYDCHFHGFPPFRAQREIPFRKPPKAYGEISRCARNDGGTVSPLRGTQSAQSLSLVSFIKKAHIACPAPCGAGRGMSTIFMDSRHGERSGKSPSAKPQKATGRFLAALEMTAGPCPHPPRQHSSSNWR